MNKFNTEFNKYIIIKHPALKRNTKMTVTVQKSGKRGMLHNLLVKECLKIAL